MNHTQSALGIPFMGPDPSTPDGARNLSTTMTCRMPKVPVGPFASQPPARKFRKAGWTIQPALRNIAFAPPPAPMRHGFPTAAPDDQLETAEPIVKEDEHGLFA